MLDDLKQLKMNMVSGDFKKIYIQEPVFDPKMKEKINVPSDDDDL